MHGRRSVGGNRAIGLRADMDALPMEEANDLSYRSHTPNRMHACGHDGQTTMLLGAAQYLAETRDFSGTVHLIFQPAEEGLAGAKAMLDDGLFERFPCGRDWCDRPICKPAEMKNARHVSTTCNRRAR